jgi:hypothetical protein
LAGPLSIAFLDLAGTARLYGMMAARTLARFAKNRVESTRRPCADSAA